MADEAKLNSGPAPGDFGQENGPCMENHWADERLKIQSFSLAGIFVLGLLYTFYLARDIVLPVALAMVLNFLFRPVVRALKNARIPPPLGAGIILLMVVGVLFLAVEGLAQPASDWVSRIPESMPQIEAKVRDLLGPMERLGRAAQQLEEIARPGDESGVDVHIRGPSLLLTLLGGTRKTIVTFGLALLLFYFMLAYGEVFFRRMISVIPRFEDKKRILDTAGEIENSVSSFLLTMTVINSITGLVIGTAMYFIGLPNPVLWGVMAGLFEFVPFLGPMVGISIVGIVALLTFESVGHALVAPLAYMILTTIEGNFIATMIYGHRFSINPVILVIWLVIWGWLWGIPGALLATPMLAMFKLLCDRIERLKVLGELIGG